MVRLKTHKLEFLASKWALSDKFHDICTEQCLTDKSSLIFSRQIKWMQQGRHGYPPFFPTIILISTTGAANADAGGIFDMNEDEREQNCIFPGVLQAKCQSVQVIHLLKM